MVQATTQLAAAMTPVVAFVDDDPAVCDSTRFLLETHGIEVRIYENAGDFLKAAPAVDCLIVDYRMPGLNGLELMAELRQQGSTIPSIMITATTDPSVERWAAQLGFRCVLRKPLASQTLLGAIRAALP